MRRRLSGEWLQPHETAAVDRGRHATATSGWMALSRERQRSRKERRPARVVSCRVVSSHSCRVEDLKSGEPEPRSAVGQDRWTGERIDWPVATGVALATHTYIRLPIVRDGVGVGVGVAVEHFQGCRLCGRHTPPRSAPLLGDCPTRSRPPPQSRSPSVPLQPQRPAASLFAACLSPLQLLRPRERRERRTVIAEKMSERFAWARA